MIFISVFILISIVELCVAPPICYNRNPWGRGPECGATAAHRQQCECGMSSDGANECQPKHCDDDDLLPDTPTTDDFQLCSLQSAVELVPRASKPNSIFQHQAVTLEIPHTLPVIFGHYVDDQDLKYKIQIKSTCAEEESANWSFSVVEKNDKDFFTILVDYNGTESLPPTPAKLIVLNDEIHDESVSECCSWTRTNKALPAKREEFKKDSCPWLQLRPIVNCSDEYEEPETDEKTSSIPNSHVAHYEHSLSSHLSTKNIFKLISSFLISQSKLSNSMKFGSIASIAMFSDLKMIQAQEQNNTCITFLEIATSYTINHVERKVINSNDTFTTYSFHADRVYSGGRRFVLSNGKSIETKLKRDKQNHSNHYFVTKNPLSSSALTDEIVESVIAAYINGNSTLNNEFWIQMAIEEHSSVASYSALTLQLMVFGAPSNLLFASSQASQIKTRHLEMFQTLASIDSHTEHSSSFVLPSSAVDQLASFQSRAQLARDSQQLGVVEGLLRVEQLQQRADAARDTSLKQLFLALRDDQLRLIEFAREIVAWASVE